MKHWRRELPQLPSSSQCSSCNTVPLNWHKKSLHPHLHKHNIKNSIKFSVREVRCILGLMLFITEEEGNAFHVHRINDCNHLSQMLCLPRETDTECKPSPLLLTHTEPVAILSLFPPKKLYYVDLQVCLTTQSLFLWKTGFFFQTNYNMKTKQH